MIDLQHRTTTAVKWSALSQGGRQALQFAVGVVLARLVAPSEFGLLAMTVVFTGFAALFSELGLTSALIQRPEVDERHYSSVFWVNLGAGLVLWALLSALAPIVAAFYHEPRLRMVTILVALNFVIAPLNMVQKAILTRGLNFRLLVVTELLAAAAGGAVGITMAFRGYGVWSLVAQSLFAAAIGVAALWVVSTWRPRLLLDKAALGQLFGFSANLLGFNVLNYWIRNADNLLVGKFLGSPSLALYARAYGLMLMPLSQVTAVVGRAMFPALSSIQKDKEAVKKLYLKAVGQIALITFPLMVGLWVVAEHFVLAVYGERWAGAVPALKIFCLLGLAQSVTSTVGWIYQSQGRTALMFAWGLGAGVMLLSSIVLGVYLGSIEGVAVCYALTSGVLLLYPSIAIPGHLIGMRFLEVVRQVWRILGCALLMGALMWAAGQALPPPAPHGVCLALLVPVGAAAYLGLVHAFRLPQYEMLRGLLFRHQPQR